MNPLEQFIRANLLNPIVVMNQLQNLGIISDETVFVSDVEDGDCKIAVEYLTRQKKP